MSQEASPSFAREVVLESGPSRADSFWRRPPRAKCPVDVARDLLGVTTALQLLPALFPAGWKRHPEFDTGVAVSGNDRRWWTGRERGDVISLVEAVSGEIGGAAAAQLIIDLIGSLPEDEREQYRPAVAVPPAQSPDSTPAVDGADLPVAAVPDDRRTTLPEIEDAADFLARDLPEPLELVTGILHQGSKMILSGGSKAFKTWTLVDLGLSVAYGRKWLGLPTRQGLVLYINLEIGDPFFRRRICTVAGAKSITIEHGHFSVMNLRGHAADLSKLLPRLLERISTRKYALIIVDPIYKLLGGRDENDAGDIAKLLNDLERLAAETRAAVVFAAHFSKGNQAGKASIDRTSGSGVFARDPDTILALTQHEEEGAFTAEATLRNHPPVEPFVVRWKFPLMERDGDLDPAKLKQVKGRPKVHSADELLKVLGEEQMTYSDWAAAAKEQAGISLTTFKSLRAELVSGGRVRTGEVKGTYRKV